jgi:hypothetical protein
LWSIGSMANQVGLLYPICFSNGRTVNSSDVPDD